MEIVCLTLNNQISHKKYFQILDPSVGLKEPQNLDTPVSLKYARYNKTNRNGGLSFGLNSNVTTVQNKNFK
jgi:hypothetical protein